MIDNGTRNYQDGPPTGENMTAFVSATKARVLRNIGAPTGHAGALEAPSASRHTSANQSIPKRVRAVGPKWPPPRNTTEPGLRKSIVALAAIVAVVALVSFAGARLIGVDTWGPNEGSPGGVGEPTVSLTPTPPASDLIEESSALEIARMSSSSPETSASGSAKAKLMTYGAWIAGNAAAAPAEIDSSQMVWIVSVNSPVSIQGDGPAESTVPASVGYTVTINANTGKLIAVIAQPTSLTFDTDPATGIPADGSIFYKTTTFGALNKYDFYHDGFADTDPVTIETIIGPFHPGISSESPGFSWQTIVFAPTTGLPYAGFALPGDPPTELLSTDTQLGDGSTWSP